MPSSVLNVVSVKVILFSISIVFTFSIVYGCVCVLWEGGVRGIKKSVFCRGTYYSSVLSLMSVEWPDYPLLLPTNCTGYSSVSPQVCQRICFYDYVMWSLLLPDYPLLLPNVKLHSPCEVAIELLVILDISFPIIMKIQGLVVPLNPWPAAHYRKGTAPGSVWNTWTSSSYVCAWYLMLTTMLHLFPDIISYIHCWISAVITVYQNNWTGAENACSLLETTIIQFGNPLVVIWVQYSWNTKKL